MWGGESDTGAITILNNSGYGMYGIQVMLNLDTPGTYGGIQFELVTDEEYTFLRGTIPQINAESSYVIDGIPLGTMFSVNGAAPASGAVPATVEMTRTE